VRAEYDACIVRPPSGTGLREGYAAALADLWSGLAPTLTNLDALAATPAEELLDRGTRILPRLQYELHAAAELALGIEPPTGTIRQHTELATALADARDVTAELLEAVEAGSLETVAGLTYTWRGALFEVRLARLRLGAAARSAAFFEGMEHRRPFEQRALLGFILVLAAVAAAVGSAVLGLSPLFAAALILLAAAAIVVRA
jgi:hypothetical protein